jgi:hypothetical protein
MYQRQTQKAIKKNKTPNWGRAGFIILLLFCIFPQLGSAYKGFLLDSKGMGGWSRGVAGPGSPGNPPPGFPGPPRPGSLAQNPKIQQKYFGALSCQKNALALLVVKK